MTRHPDHESIEALRRENAALRATQEQLRATVEQSLRDIMLEREKAEALTAKLEAQDRQLVSWARKAGLKEQQIESLARELAEKKRRIDQLEERLQALLKRLYGRRSERIDPGQLLLPGFEESEPVDAAVAKVAVEAPDEESVATAAPRKKRAKRTEKLKDLPRNRIVHDVAEADRVCACCGDSKQPIGEEVTEEIDYVPASVVVNEHVRQKYACKRCGDGVVIAPLPPRIVDGGMPGPGLVAQIVTAKYGDHLPLHRQEAIFKRHGLSLSRKTMCDWVRVAADLLLPIVLAMRRQLLARKVIQSDDTPVLVQTNADSKGCHRAFLWTWVAADGDIVLYDFSLSRSGEVPKAFLDGFSGDVLLRDGYAAYNGCARDGVQLAGCWAHARRKVHEAVGSHPLDAGELLGWIQMLYLVERRAKEADVDLDARTKLRLEESQPILIEIEKVLDRLSGTVLPASSLGKAIAYIQNQWEGLCRFAKDGRIPIDNNASERAMRRVAVGRKNWIFCGSQEGGKRAAILYSLIETCKRVGVEPFAYLRDVLARVSIHPHRLIDELTPAGWKAARAAAAPTATT